MMNALQFIIATVLFFVLMFGIGFILNMLLKTTWLAIYLYFGMIVVLIFYWGTGTFLENISEYTLFDYIPAIGGLAGAVVSGFAIKELRVRGYRMF